MLNDFSFYFIPKYYCDPSLSLQVLQIESQNPRSWMEPIRIIESKSLLLAGLPKTKPYD